MTTLHSNWTYARLDEVCILLDIVVFYFQNKEPEVSVDGFDRFAQGCL